MGASFPGFTPDVFAPPVWTAASGHPDWTCSRALGQCAGPIRKMYGARAGNPEELCGFSMVNFARIAEEMGCLGIRVERPDEIAPALRAAGAAGRPVVVDVFTDVSCCAPEPWTP